MRSEEEEEVGDDEEEEEEKRKEEEEREEGDHIRKRKNMNCRILNKEEEKRDKKEI